MEVLLSMYGAVAQGLIWTIFVLGVYPPDRGKILLDDEPVTNLPEYKRAKHLGRVFQDPMMGTVANMEIQENLAMSYRRGKHRGLKWGISKEEKMLYMEKLKNLDLGLEDRMILS